jgi:hypothetical protein
MEDEGEISKPCDGKTPNFVAKTPNAAKHDAADVI